MPQIITSSKYHALAVRQHHGGGYVQLKRNHSVRVIRKNDFTCFDRISFYRHVYILLTYICVVTACNETAQIFSYVSCK